MGELIFPADGVKRIAEERQKVYLRREFLRLLTEDSKTQDRRKKDYNQAIFASFENGGYAIFNGTDLQMVMDKFDKAIRLREKQEASQ